VEVTRLALSLIVVSVAAGPGLVSARAPQTAHGPELVPDPQQTVPASRVDGALSLRIDSAILGETRPITVVLPASYARSAPERRYSVTVVLDGEANVPPAAAVSSELARNGQIPESVIVAIPNLDPMRGRLRDLTPPGLSVSGSGLGEGGDRFLDFIERELLPAVDRRFRGGAPRTLVGHSSGGILATYAAATRPTFRAVVAIDTPIELGDNWLARRLTDRARRATEPLRYVSLEARFGWPEAVWTALVAAAPASWRLHRERLVHESHESIGMLGMYLGLREAFADYSGLAAPVAPTTSILAYYVKLGEALGAPVVPPEALLRSVAEDLAAEGRGAAAREVYTQLVAAYGAPSDGAELVARIAEVERRPPPAETVEGLLATPFPGPEQTRAFLGDWVGDITMSPDAPRTDRLRLRLRVVDGRVVGETIQRMPSGEARVQSWEYLKITPEGMTWGVMNGMRPRGVVLFEGRLEGDTLAGTSRFGGMDFRTSDGSRPPPLYFSFRRVREGTSHR
jgi:hypothetical protein